MNPLDYSLFFWVNGAAGRNSLLDFIGVLLGQYGIYFFAAFMLVLWFVLPRRAADGRRHLVYGAAAAVVGLLTNYVISHLVYRPRPFVLYPHQVHLLVQHVPDSSFPSDHATAVFAVATALVGSSKWLSRTFWIVAILIAIARVFIGVHWPTDVLAGLVIGLIASLAVRRVHTLLDPMIDWFLRLFRLPTNAERMPDR
jgi:undecaprenyl-diphosphatase